jgi:hypothetical protein
MRHYQNAHPRLTGLAAALATVLFLIPPTPAAPPSDGVSGNQNGAGGQSSAAQTALTIAGAAAMTGAEPAAAAPATAVQPAGSKRPMTAEERQHFMMLLILHETSRNPIGALH